ncbi:ribosome biogenesis protein ytm1 [Didymosphaeria variabile]|uniref:Ribosome biogenesis protein ytm1 n=1 Tax=Didymosphaeria variabile TaxID=1932322 RepID=A0A9W9C555_9PLEO|nr:ribosome biogenesis protein ytm1 [Didymosphaeria variabile]KAJ4344802.1 ribosome biogenesis protein ytm1 [Didymosphaeria variabile]
MSSSVSDQELGDALLHSVQHGSFPQSEHVSSAPVGSAALPKLRQTLEKARDDTKEQIRQVSREAASDVDGWMTQARKLQADIKRSQETAKEIVQQAESGKEKTAKVQDAASKVSFLHSEIAYNESLVRVVEQLKDISTLLESAQDAAVRNHILHALERLEDADSAFKRLGPFENTRVVGLLKTKSDHLRADIVENVTEIWNSLLYVNTAEQRFTLKEKAEREDGISIGTVVEALTRLGLLDKFISRLSRDFDSIIVQPRLTIGPDQVVSALTIYGDDIQVAGQVSDMSVQAALEDIQAIADYLSTRMPPDVAVPLSEKLVPVIANRLISSWLLPAIPLSTKGIPDFQETLSLVLGLVESFDELGWSGQQRLTDWVDKSAEKWLARQKEAAIAQVQRTFPKRVQEKKTVERVETQVLSRGDAMLGKHEEQDEDWGADWGDDGAAEEEPVEDRETQQNEAMEEEDMSAWGMDEDEPQEPQKETKGPKPEAQGEEDAEDWGADWGDEEEPKQHPPSAEPQANGQAAKAEKPSKNREMTLRETYTVTAIPDSIIDMILQAVSDVGTLNTPDLVGSAIAPASSGLFAIPSLLLAMYRATAATHYSRDIAANMLIYNDCTRLSDRLRAFLTEQAENDASSGLPQHLKPSVRLKPRLDQDIKAIEAFGKRAYGREMESQRTIIRDHLDAAQGFSGCTKMPFAAECDNAIAMTIDRIADVKNAWKPVLSHSALLQSLGSLVSTALAKFITDIEDMTDIAEDESKKLRGYCISLSSLSALFITGDDDGEQRDMTSVYTPNWFKFQYLSEILDSSLADIKYMWTDGELKLEMDVEEVLDLIRALFAESEYRRKAVADIRRAAGR